MRISDWSSDVCSSDLIAVGRHGLDHVDLRAVAVDGDPAQAPGVAGDLQARLVGICVDALTRADPQLSAVGDVDFAVTVASPPHLHVAGIGCVLAGVEAILRRENTDASVDRKSTRLNSSH